MNTPYLLGNEESVFLRVELLVGQAHIDSLDGPTPRTAQIEADGLLLKKKKTRIGAVGRRGWVWKGLGEQLGEYDENTVYATFRELIIL